MKIGLLFLTMQFLGQFLRDPKHTGAVMSSSKRLARSMTAMTDLSQKRCVVEFGSGDGVVTEDIGGFVSDSCVFFSMEINRLFVEKTRERCPGVTVYHDSAEHVGEYLERHGQSSCDAIISGLPWAGFSEEQQDLLLDAAYNALDEEGEFVTFGYISGLLLPAGKRFRQRLYETFRDVEVGRVVWRNFPPAFVYHCRK